MRDTVIALLSWLHMSTYRYVDNPPLETFPIVEAFAHSRYIHVYYAHSPCVQWNTLSIGASVKTFTFWWNAIPADVYTPKFEIEFIKIIW